MKRIWLVIVLIEAILLVVFCRWASSTDYFVRMPASVRAGSSVTALIAVRAVWLAAVFGILNASVAAWVRGFRAKDESDRGSAVLPLAGSVAFFLVACWLLAMFIFFGFPQY